MRHNSFSASEQIEASFPGFPGFPRARYTKKKIQYIFSSLRKICSEGWERELNIFLWTLRCLGSHIFQCRFCELFCCWVCVPSWRISPSKHIPSSLLFPEISQCSKQPVLFLWLLMKRGLWRDWDTTYCMNEGGKREKKRDEKPVTSCRDVAATRTLTKVKSG